MTVHRNKDPSQCTEPVGGTRRLWLAEDVDRLAPQYCRPREPAIAIHLHTTMCPADLMLLMQGAKVPEHRNRRDTNQKVISEPIFLPEQEPTETEQNQGQKDADTKSDQAQSQSDSHNQATGNAPRNGHRGKPRKKTSGGTSNIVFGESFQLVSSWKPIGTRLLVINPVLGSAPCFFYVVENCS